MYYEIVGGSRREKKLVEQALWFAKNELLPRIRNLDIEVKIGKFTLEGSLLGASDDREFVMEVKKGMPEEDVITTVFHEFVHIKQYVRDEIIECDWDLPYLERPHEIEAYKLQEVMWEKFKNL